MVRRGVRVSTVVVSLLSTCLYVPVAAQMVHTVEEDRKVRLASVEEGEAVVQAAWELRRGLDPKPDCSHFVNAIYARAGLDYEYASSSEIFEGIDSFRRVQRPQPGDLVVWLGHVGIVIDPEQHSFYSSVLSGFAIEDYRSDYWKSRGRPRFYRYVIDDIYRARVAAHLKEAQMKEAQTGPAPAQSGYDSRLLSGRDPDEQNNASSSFRDSNENLDPATGDTEISDVIFVSTHTRPSKEEVRAAVIHLADAQGRHLFERCASHSAQMVVAEEVRVAEPSIHGRSGFVDLEVTETGSIRCGAVPKQVADKWQVTLRRGERGWVLLAPQDHIYLRRDLAIRALAEQVAILSRGAANNREIRQAVKALDDLLTRQAPAPTASLQSGDPSR